MRKFFSPILISVLVFGTISPVFSASLERDLNVKFTSAGDDTYTTNLTNISRNNTDLTFQFVEISGGGVEEYSINLPTGFTYQSANTTGTDCAGFTVINSSNNNYHFSFNGAPNCIAKTEFTYRVTNTTTPGSNPLYLLEKSGVNWNIAADLSLNVTATNSVTSAVVQDLDADGYIDAYLLSFASLAGVNAGTLSTLTVAGVTPGVATASGSNWILPFTDGVFATGQLPQIGGVFDTVTINNTTITESLQSIHCTASTRTVNTHSYSIPLFNNATTTSVVSSAVAIANGTVTYTQVFACAMSAVNISGIETIGTPTCNAGYQVSGSSCVAIPPSSGGGGGGSVYTPPVILITPVSTGSVSTGLTDTGTLTTTETLTV
ncbi:MAG: hypothetical protein Q8K26_03530, partial [Candidatus Gracilibacteria bacterium]|nr:hypothetical protein [Candidatus Gracilibacteria bacterium]